MGSKVYGLLRKGFILVKVSKILLLIIIENLIEDTGFDPIPSFDTKPHATENV